MNYPLVFVFIGFFVIVSIVITYITQKSSKSTADFYVGGNKIPWIQTGIAMLGSYLSAASFLGVAGDIAVKGVDRTWLAIGFYGGYIAVLMLIAGPLRNVGSYTVADAMFRRFPDRRIKLVVMITTVIISTFYLVPQLVAAGKLFEMIIGWKFLAVIISVGILISIYIIFGGMKATIYNQVIQATFLWIAMIAIVVFGVVLFFGGDFGEVFKQAENIVVPNFAGLNKDAVAAVLGKESHEAIAAVNSLLANVPNKAMTIGLQTPDIISQLSTVLALLFGTAGLPHILIMFYTVPSAKAAKKSVMLTIFALGIFYLASIVLGFMCMNLVYPDLLGWIGNGEMGKAVNMVVLKISEKVGGQFLMAISAAGAVAAVLSTAAGLMITVSSTISHDLYKTFINSNATEKQELSIAKITTVAMSTIAIILALVLQNQNVAWLIALAFGISSSAIFPTMISLLWWKRFTRQAALASMITGLVVSLIFIILLLSGVKSFIGFSTLGGPGLFGITLSSVVLIVVTFLTKDTGKDVEEFFAVAHKEEKH
ncbi:MAG: hypothetical protein A2Y41_07905 [Spirochaetes bacterium GWB1_36_13]|nr:MAG: hypothetical protein A2Y41_07905 [Spirochaetes bacterium GWB1_36_13]